MKKVLACEISLLTPTGKVLTPMQIVYDDADVITNPTSEIILRYNGNEYKGYGTDYLWTDTLADLEINLPENVKLACCMTCRHGNMCPYGNAENELICTNGLKINSKEDMCKLFDQTNPFKERAVASLDYCNEFIYQSDDCYTYNDYLYQLYRKRESRAK